MNAFDKNLDSLVFLLGVCCGGRVYNNESSHDSNDRRVFLLTFLQALSTKQYRTYCMGACPLLLTSPAFVNMVLRRFRLSPSYLKEQAA